MAEWSNALVLKTSVPQGTVGSNPTSSAIDPVVQLVRIPACHAGGREFESRPDRKSTYHALTDWGVPGRAYQDKSFTRIGSCKCLYSN